MLLSRRSHHVQRRNVENQQRAYFAQENTWRNGQQREQDQANSSRVANMDQAADSRRPNASRRNLEPRRASRRASRHHSRTPRAGFGLELEKFGTLFDIDDVTHELNNPTKRRRRDKEKNRTKRRNPSPPREPVERTIAIDAVSHEMRVYENGVETDASAVAQEMSQVLNNQDRHERRKVQHGSNQQARNEIEHRPTVEQRAEPSYTQRSQKRTRQTRDHNVHRRHDDEQIPTRETMGSRRGHEPRKPTHTRDPRVRRRHCREHSEAQRETMNEQKSRGANDDDHPPGAMNFNVGLDSMEVGRLNANVDSRDERRKPERAVRSSGFDQHNIDNYVETSRGSRHRTYEDVDRLNKAENRQYELEPETPQRPERKRRRHSNGRRKRRTEKRDNRTRLELEPGASGYEERNEYQAEIDPELLQRDEDEQARSRRMSWKRHEVETPNLGDEDRAYEPEGDRIYPTENRMVRISPVMDHGENHRRGGMKCNREEMEEEREEVAPEQVGLFNDDVEHVDIDEPQLRRSDVERSILYHEQDHEDSNLELEDTEVDGDIDNINAEHELCDPIDSPDLSPSHSYNDSDEEATRQPISKRKYIWPDRDITKMHMMEPGDFSAEVDAAVKSLFQPDRTTGNFQHAPLKEKKRVLSGRKPSPSNSLGKATTTPSNVIGPHQSETQRQSTQMNASESI